MVKGREEVQNRDDWEEERIKWEEKVGSSITEYTLVTERGELTKVVAWEAPELPPSHGGTKCTAAHGQSPCERNPESEQLQQTRQPRKYPKQRDGEKMQTIVPE